MKILRAIDAAIARLAGWILVLVLSVMVVMAFGQVLLRNVFGTSIVWGDILLRHLVLWVGFLGATIATGEGRHIKVELLTKFVPPKAQKILGILAALFSAVICALLLQASIVFIDIGIDPGSTLILNIPTTYFVVIIPIGFGLMAFRFLVVAIGHSAEALRGEWGMEVSA